MLVFTQSLWGRFCLCRPSEFGRKLPSAYLLFFGLLPLIHLTQWEPLCLLQGRSA
jgi:hypothetical protein